MVLFARPMRDLLFRRWLRYRGLIVFRGDSSVRRWLYFTLGNWLTYAVSASLLAWITEALYGVEITVDAAITGDRNLFVQALLYDRSVPNLRAAEALADDLLKAHAAHLPQFA